VAQIAELLSLSPRTVGTHLYNIKQKLQAQNAAELTLIALRAGSSTRGYERPAPETRAGSAATHHQASIATESHSADRAAKGTTSAEVSVAQPICRNSAATTSRLSARATSRG
jgi:hypothetical protein